MTFLPLAEQSAGLAGVKDVEIGLGFDRVGRLVRSSFLLCFDHRLKRGRVQNAFGDVSFGHQRQFTVRGRGNRGGSVVPVDRTNGMNAV